MTLLAILLAGCDSRATAAASMQRALDDTSDALVGVLLGSEILGHMYDMPQQYRRHSPNSQCGAACPCVLQTGLTLPVQLTLDYMPTGCVPDSRLIPAAMTGHVKVDFDGEQCHQADFIDLQLALTHPVTGRFGGAVAGTPADQTVHPKGDLVVEDTKFSVDLTVRLADQVYIDGTTEVSGPSEPLGRVTFEGVVLPWDSIGTPCPRPTKGTATLEADPVVGGPNAMVRYDQPGNGFVTVAVGGRVSDPVDYCAYSSALW